MIDSFAADSKLNSKTILSSINYSTMASCKQTITSLFGQRR